MGTGPGAGGGTVCSMMAAAYTAKTLYKYISVFHCFVIKLLFAADTSAQIQQPARPDPPAPPDKGYSCHIPYSTHDTGAHCTRRTAFEVACKVRPPIEREVKIPTGDYENTLIDPAAKTLPKLTQPSGTKTLLPTNGAASAPIIGMW